MGRIAPERPFVWTDDGWIHFAMWSTAPIRARCSIVCVPTEATRSRECTPVRQRRRVFNVRNGRRWACVVTRALSDLYLIRDFDPGRP